jgi:hypothetical protein
MSQKNVRAPRLPDAPVEYDPRFMSQLLSILRLYFNQLDNAGPMAASTEQVNGKIVAALSFVRPDPTTPNTFIISLPTEADLSNLRVGDVYYDTTADNVLKVKV